MKSLKFLPLLLIAACDTSTDDVGQTLRTGEPVCPPGCVCTCEPLDTSSSGVVGSDSTTQSTDTDTDTDTSAVESSGAETTGATVSQNVPDAVAALGATMVDIFDDNYPDLLEGAMVTLPSGRRFRIMYPADWDHLDPQTLVTPIFAFHPRSGRGANPPGTWDSYHHSQNGGFMVISPEGTTFGSNADRYEWHTWPESDDFAYVTEVIQAVESWAFVDSSRRLLTGWSNGSFMAQSVGCNLGADVVVAGAGALRYTNGSTLFDMPESCVGTPELFLHHGVNDQRVPFSFAVEGRDFWAGSMGCTNPQLTTQPLDWCSDASCDPELVVGDPVDLGCYSYTCNEGALTFCADTSGDPPWYHSFSTTSGSQRAVGEILFPQ